MNTQRYQMPRKTPRPTLYLGVSAALWSGTFVVAVVILGILYCMLTNRVPI